VVPGEHDVDAELLRVGTGLPQLGVGGVLGLQLHPDAHRRVGARHGVTTWPLPTTVMPDSVTEKPRASSCSCRTRSTCARDGHVLVDDRPLDAAVPADLTPSRMTLLSTSV
jgi:hypothetical protein